MQVENRKETEAALASKHEGSALRERMAEQIADISGQRVPVSSFSRLWTLGSLHARVAGGYLAYWVRSRFADEDERSRLRSEAHLSAALKLFGTMGYLRGAVMKVGQLLGNLPEVVPEEFAEVLSALHFEAPPMHFAMVREVFLDEFGREPEQVFSSFERRPFAAASLGQVHRATLPTGEEVAVKIQYPGIARTIKGDLRSLRLLLQPISLSSDWQNTLEKLADIEQMLLMETDYRQEARFYREARGVFGEGDGIVVPEVFGEYSTKRVLTTEYLRGCHLEEFLAGNPPPQLRDRFTTLLTVGTFRLYFRLHWLLADPHPGNFLFMEDGRLGLIDFGCIRTLDEEDWELCSGTVEAAMEGDGARLDRTIAKACLFQGPDEMEADWLHTVRTGFHWFMEPWVHEGVFDFGDRDFFLRGIDNLMEGARKHYTRSVPMTTWSNRFTFGGRAVCYRLKGRCEFRKIYLQESSF